MKVSAVCCNPMHYLHYQCFYSVALDSNRLEEVRPKVKLNQGGSLIIISGICCYTSQFSG